MKRWMMIALMVVATCTGWALGAEKKAVEKVSVEALTKETQRSPGDDGTSAPGKEGMNFVWYVPTEFWEATLIQNKSLNRVDAESTINELKGIFIVCIARSQIDAAAKFNFFDEATVKKNLAVSYTDKAGKVHKLAIEEKLNPTTESILSAMKPALKGALGQMGQSMYFFAYRDTAEDGTRMVSPLQAGKLSMTLMPLTGERGGTLDIQFPLNSLFVPRECAVCHTKNMNILWHFCPNCGAPLKD